jgi:hypothetical protein
MAAVQQNGTALQYAAEGMNDNDAIVMAAVKSEGAALKHASARLQDDFDTVLAAVSTNGKAAKYASKRLQNDPRIQIAMLDQDINTLTRIDRKTRHNREFVRQWLEASDTLPFKIAELNDVWQPCRHELAELQAKALARMPEDTARNLLRKRARFNRAAWGDADLVFAADPTVTATKIDFAAPPAPRGRLKRLGHALAHAVTFGHH